MKYYPALCGALCFFILVLIGSRWGACDDVEIGAAAHAATTPRMEEPPVLLGNGDPSDHPECTPLADELLVIAACIDDGATTTEWASTDAGFVADATWEELTDVRAVAVYCETASTHLFPYRRKQVLATLEDGFIRAPCDGAHFVHFFAP